MSSEMGECLGEKGEALTILRPLLGGLLDVDLGACLALHLAIAKNVDDDCKEWERQPVHSGIIDPTSWKMAKL